MKLCAFCGSPGAGGAKDSFCPNDFYNFIYLQSSNHYTHTDLHSKHVFICHFLFFKKQSLHTVDILWKILKEMGIPDHLICLLRSLYAGQEATVRTGHGITDWFQIGKGVH